MKSQETEASPTRAEIETELSRLLASEAFNTRGRSRTFLRFVVEESLAGRRERLKGYTLGVEVCGRRDDFDPQGDAIVRVEAGRLRKRLAHYYLTEGASDPVLIRIPTGSYAPEFSYRDTGSETPVSEDAEQPAPLPTPIPEAPIPPKSALSLRATTWAPAAVLLAVFALGTLTLAAIHINQKLNNVLDLQAEIAEAIADSVALDATMTLMSSAAQAQPSGTPQTATEVLASNPLTPVPHQPLSEPSRFCPPTPAAELRAELASKRRDCDRLPYASTSKQTFNKGQQPYRGALGSR